MADILIRNAYVVTMNAQRQIFSDGAVAIEGNRITAVGTNSKVLSEHTASHIIDARGMMVIPGLIDGHLHPNHYLSTGIHDDGEDLLAVVFKRLHPYEAALTPEEAYFSGLGGFVEATKHGTTCFNDPGGIHPDSTAQAAIDVGIRGILSRSTRDLGAPYLPESLVEDTDTNLREGEVLIKRWHNQAGGRLRAWFSLRFGLNVSDKLCREIKKLADSYAVGIHVHAACYKGENEENIDRFGKRSVERLYELGMFGPTLYLAHMGFPDDREVKWLKEHDVKVSHCPSASMLGGYGVIANRMIPKMVESGIAVSLGTDSATAGGNLDMIRVMFLAACAHKDASADASLMGPWKALEMATIEGARACLWDDEIGSLESGMLADMILVNMTGLENHQGREPISNLLYSLSGRDVDTVIIDGRVVMRKRVILTVDEAYVKRQVEAASYAVRKRVGTPPHTSPWPIA